jgi:hypothetical protein
LPRKPGKSASHRTCSSQRESASVWTDPARPTAAQLRLLGPRRVRGCFHAKAQAGSLHSDSARAYADLVCG